MIMKGKLAKGIVRGASITVLATVLVTSPALAQGGAAVQETTVPVPGTAPPAAGPQDNVQPAPDAAAETQDIVVTGFRSSLARALDQKQTSASAIDTILAEDIGKFPDLNLSESIQRIPGVALSRDGGEGRNISVRGLGPQFTRVRINGMEAIATTGGSDASGGTNRGRGFDFNIFAADLFNQITVRKTAEAVVEEGSLGATVDLRTAHPFDYNGFTISASAQASYNDQSEKATPRAAFLISDTFADGRIGVLFSAAYTKRKVVESGYSTVRWATNALGVAPGFESVTGSTCISPDGTVVTPAPAACTQANTALHPRFPRYDYFVTNQERLGMTGSIQLRPTDTTTISIDGLYADLNGNREERYLEANGFSVAGACTTRSRPTNCGVADTDVRSLTIEDGVLTAGTFDDVDLRVENRYDTYKTKFRQITGTVEQEISDTLSISLLGGHSQSDFDNPIQDTVSFDQFNVDGYSYDYTDKTHPTFGFGTTDITSPNGWVLSQLRLRASGAKNSYDTGQLNLSWKVNPEFELVVGGVWKKYSSSSSELRRSNGTTASQDTNVACCTLPGDTLDKFGQVYTIEGTSFFGPSFFAANEYFGLTDPTARGGTFVLGIEPALSSNTSVQEKDKSGFFQANFNHDFGGLVLRGNAGLRYVETQQTANGYSYLSGAVTPITTRRTYEDWLPSANLVLQPSEQFLVRAAAARVMARPDLTSIPPFATVGVSGATRSVTAGNPNLDPYRATTYDVSFEWYYQRGALLSLALFQKDIDSFVQTVTSQGAFSANPFGLPDSLAIAACGNQYPDICNPAYTNWTFSVPSNTPGGRLRGLEVNFQQPLRFLPGPLGNLGVLLNYTHVESNIQYLNSSGAVVATADLTGLSRDSANGTLYYEDRAFSARLTGSYRSKYLTDPIGRQGTDQEGVNSTFNLDASLQYTVSDRIKISLEAVNLTNQAQYQYVDSANLLNVYHTTGREFLAGIRFNL